MASKYKLVVFGSDLVSLRVLSKLHESRHFPSIKLVCPPLKKPRTPLASLHAYLNEHQLPIL